MKLSKIKQLGILVVMLMIVSAVVTITVSADEVDQQQIKASSAICFGWYYSKCAQSFKPSLDTLTKVELLIGKKLYGNPNGTLIVSIRSSLDGNELTSSQINVDDLPIDSHWIEFDFPDISVIPEDSYYIHCEGIGTLDGAICWLQESPGYYYKRGEAWTFGNDIWYEHENADFCFKTYGYDSYDDKPPVVDIINPIAGSIVTGTVNITVSASDDNGIEKVKFYIDDYFKHEISHKPYYWLWDTSLYDEGNHSITVAAFDTGGNTASDEIPVIVASLRIESVTGGFGRVYANIANHGHKTDRNVDWTITIHGGMLGRIQIRTMGSIPYLEQGDVERVSTHKFIAGIGFIGVSVTAEADNAIKVSKEKTGFILGPFIIILY